MPEPGIKDVPAEQRLYTFEEVVLMLDGWCQDWPEVREKYGERNEEAVRGWVEHMDAGDCSVGRPA